MVFGYWGAPGPPKRRPKIALEIRLVFSLILRLKMDLKMAPKSIQNYIKSAVLQIRLDYSGAWLASGTATIPKVTSKGPPEHQNESKMAPQGTKKPPQWPPSASASLPKAPARHQNGPKDIKSTGQLLNKCCFSCRCCGSLCCSLVLLPWCPHPFDTAIRKKGRRGPRSVYNNNKNENKKKNNKNL